MSDVYLLGDVVDLATVITDTNGTAADPTSLTLTYTNTATGTAVTKNWPVPADLTHDSTGHFSYSITSGLTAAHYRYVWTSAGLNAGSDDDIFEVIDPAAVPRLVSLTDAKNYLRLTGTSDDDLLNRMITWASARLTREVSALTATTYTDTVFIDSSGGVLPRTPVISVTSITPLTLYAPTVDVSTVIVTNPDAGTIGYSGAYTYGGGYYTVVYRAGYTTVPPGVDGACLDLIRHWWVQGQAHQSSTYAQDGPAFVPDFATLPNVVTNKLAVVPRIGGIA